MSCYAWRIILHISKSYGDKWETWLTCTKSQTVLQVYQTVGTQFTLWITCHTVWEWSQSKTPVLCCELIPVVLTVCPLSAGLQSQSYGSSGLGTQSNNNHFQPTDVCDGRSKCINKVDGDKKKKEKKENPQCVSEVALSFPLYILIPLELPRSSWIPGLVSMSHVLFTYYSLRDIPSTHGEQG